MLLAHLLIIAVCAGVCYTARSSLRAQVLKIGIFASLGIIHGLVPALTTDELRNSSSMYLLDSRFTDGARTSAAWYAFASVSLLALGWGTFDSWNNRGAQLSNKAVYQVIFSRRGQALLIFMFWVSMALTLLALALQLFSTGASLSEFAQASRFEYRSRDAMMSLVWGHLMSFGFIPGSVGFFLSSRYRSLGIVFTVTLTLLLFFVFAKGTRNLPLGLLSGLGIAYVMRYPVTGKRLALFCFGASVIGLLTVSLYEVRKVMSSASLSELATTMCSVETYQESLTSDPLNYHEYLVAAMALVPEHHHYFEGATYRRILFFWMPTSWENSWKPQDTNILFARVLDPRIRGDVTIPPSIPGDVYVNFWGWWGLPALFMQGALLAWISKKMYSNVLWFTIFGAMSGRFFLLVIRGQPYDLFVMILFILVAVYLISLINPYSFSQAQRDVHALVRRSIVHGLAQRRALRKPVMPVHRLGTLRCTK